MVQLTTALNPEDIERYLASALGEAKPIGRYHEAWHILRATDAMPALVLFRHVTISIDDLYRLCNLLLSAGIQHGYMVYVESDMPAEIIHAAGRIGIHLVDHIMVENLLTQELNKRNQEATP